MLFYITVHNSEYGYSVACPTLKGCHSQGDTEEEAIDNIKDAIRDYLECLEELENKHDTKLIKIEVSL